MKVVLLGDVHGHWTELNQLLMRLRDRAGVEAAIQVGDLGIERKRLERFAKTTGRFALPLFAIDGNHDDHAFLARALRNGQTRVWGEQHNLHFQPRASVAGFSRTLVGFLGGALHVVRPQRHGLFSGAPNYVLQKDAIAAAKLFNRARPALIVTHSCPSGIGIGMQGHPALGPSLQEHVVQAGFDPGPADDRGESALRLLWDHLQYRPATWVFGHFHVSRQTEISRTQFNCLPAMDDSPIGRALCWESETNAVTTEVL